MPNIIEIQDLNSEELDIYGRFSESRLLNLYAPNGGIFIAESPKVIERALDSGYKPVSALIEKKHIETQGQEIIKRLGDVPIYTGEFDLLTNLTGFKLTRGMLCAMKRKELPTVSEVCHNAKRIAVLEDVVNPTNVGAIFRSAAALNIDGVILTSTCRNPLYRRAIRVSMGTVFQIKLTIAHTKKKNINEILHQLGFKTAAMALKEESVNIDNDALMNEDRLAIILGTEGEGLTEETINGSDYTVCIPMSNGVDSLNVAAASAVAFWQLGNK